MNKTGVLWFGGVVAAAGIAYAVWRQKRDSIGYVDNIRIDKDGHANVLPRTVDASPRSAPMAVRAKARTALKHGKPYQKAAADVVESPNVMAPTAGGWTASTKGSPIFTNTSKVRAPSWSLEAGRTCPAVAFPVRTIVEEMKKSGLPRNNEELASRIASEIPAKCLACYATGGNYMYDSSKIAQARRLKWWDSTPDDELVNTMVDAIKHAGDTRCNIAEGNYTPKDLSKNYEAIPGTKGCVYTPMTQPKYFRLFDSGDFHDARAARLWRRIITKVNAGPVKTKFWIPTTAHKAKCGTAEQSAEQQEIVAELKQLAKDPNVVVRASADIINHTAPRPFGHAGAAVTDRPEVYPIYKENEEITKYGQMKVNRVQLPDENGKLVDHWVCPGDCSVCRKCWDKTTPVAYPLHTKTIDTKNAIHMLARTFSATNCLHPDKVKSAECKKQDKLVKKVLARELVRIEQIGPK